MMMTTMMVTHALSMSAAGTGGPRPRAAHVTAYMNSHSGCLAKDGSPAQPNLRARVDPSKGLGSRAIAFVASRDLSAGEELFFDYGEEHDMTAVSSESSSDDEVWTAMCEVIAEEM
eukprot:TRINITY_DN7240_c0_g3_i1.p3 TRINITY_DN7240_c0_g3~~TRINITY_DN7240_c0_g3_i1.p3  ORF type:complete len:116 (-),score=26.90 TRINITY_DN7240_c0_g3_i1:440-787(-)